MCNIYSLQLFDNFEATVTNRIQTFKKLQVYLFVYEKVIHPSTQYFININLIYNFYWNGLKFIITTGSHSY